MLAQLSTLNLTFFSIIISLLIAIFGGIWRAGTRTGKALQELADLKQTSERRLTELEDHVYEHDQWHLRSAQRRMR